ncbi:MAG TPA: zinc dependent phospholipase C family protein [Thermodesulfovibrionales bacterium]|nr:zinc dependent phospholipase C family protein [Thermodesulfovibrionales bacterium]
MFLRLFLVIFFILIPSLAFAWGPLTHVYLGSEMYYLGSVLPVWVFNLLKKYRGDYLYGNLMADIILAKNLLPLEKNSHSWEVGFSLLESSRKSSEKAFSLGYISHLAADTVAHGIYTRRKNIEHTVIELRADSLIDRKYWVQARGIDRVIQYRNDRFLEKSLDRVFFSFKTNKRIFRGMLFLSGLNKQKFGEFIDRNLLIPFKKEDIMKLHEESLDRIVDVLRNGDRSAVLKKNPIAR